MTSELYQVITLTTTQLLQITTAQHCDDISDVSRHHYESSPVYQVTIIITIVTTALSQLHHYVTAAVTPSAAQLYQVYYKLLLPLPTHDRLRLP